MIKRLAIDHQVELLTADTNDPKLLNDLIPELAQVHYFTHHTNFRGLRKIFFYLITCFLTCLLQYPEHYHTVTNRSLRKRLKELIQNKNYDFLLLHYWFLQKILPKNAEKHKVVIDTHGLIFTKVQLEAYSKKGFIERKIDNAYAVIYKKQEVDSLNKAGLLIFNAEIDKQYYKNELHGKVKCITVSNGQDLDYFSTVSIIQARNTILFYGSLGGVQNQEAFKNYWDKIHPIILEKTKNVHLIILGNEPPKWIKELQSEEIIVTGYVEDIRPYLSKSNVCILPLTLGAGFRGRVIEVMASGIPVVGSHNALDNVNMVHGVHGFITDNYQEMAEYTLQIIKNSKLRRNISQNCISFTHENYSIEATYGRLSEILLSA